MVGATEKDLVRVRGVPVPGVKVHRPTLDLHPGSLTEYRTTVDTRDFPDNVVRLLGGEWSGPLSDLFPPVFLGRTVGPRKILGKIPTTLSGRRTTRTRRPVSLLHTPSLRLTPVCPSVVRPKTGVVDSGQVAQRLMYSVSGRP